MLKRSAEGIKQSGESWLIYAGKQNQQHNKINVIGWSDIDKIENS